MVGIRHAAMNNGSRHRQHERVVNGYHYGEIRTNAKGPSGAKVSQPAGCARKGPLAGSYTYMDGSLHELQLLLGFVHTCTS